MCSLTVGFLASFAKVISKGFAFFCPKSPVFRIQDVIDLSQAGTFRAMHKCLADAPELQ